MVGPLEVSNSVLKLGVIVDSIANIDDEVLISVLIVQVLCDIRDAIPVHFFKDSASWEGHRYDPLWNMR